MSMEPKMILTAGELRAEIHADGFSLYRADRLLFAMRPDSPVSRCGDGTPDRDGERTFSCVDGTAVWRCASTLWSEKRYTLEAVGTALRFRVAVTGRGAIGRVEYLRGSQYEASGYFLPSPAPRAFPPERSIIAPGRIEPVFQTPPLFAFPFEFPDCGFLAVGLAAQKGENLFDQFEYTPFAEPYTLVNLRAAWSTDLRGYRTADGTLQLPDLTFHFGTTPYDALRAYAETLYAAYGCVRRPAERPPRWHLGPFFCGWGQQYEYADQDPKSAATQRCYTEMTDELERKQIRPRAVMIDDKWMRDYGTLEPDPDKWPDLRGFVERQHARNCKVLLWIPCWKTEGLDVAECGTLHSDRICADPTAPAYRARIERTFARLLGDGPGNFNCDGFKIDFANQPAPMRVPGVRTVAGLAGMELTKALFALFYRCAKAVKPDALLNHSAAHPYFAEVTDQCRLHDYDGNERSAMAQMGYRARLFECAIPGVPIDTDNVFSSPAETLTYLRRAPELGAPDLYFSHGYRGFEFDGAVAETIRRTWSAYVDRVNRQYGDGENDK